MTINAQMSRGHDDDLLGAGNYQSEGVPIVFVTQEDAEDEESEDEWLDILPLPSSKYRFTKWHEIENINVSSSMLKAPRVRRAPACYKKDTIYAIEEQDANDSDIDLESGLQVAGKKKKKKRKKRQDFRNKLENWQTCECVNLSYQELGHGYQVKNFYKVLNRLVRCTEIQLMENSLTDLHSISFPSCQRLYLQRNYLRSLKKLPRLPNIEHLSLQQNHIQNLEGIEIFKRSRLKSLILEGNPVALEKDYRKRIFYLLPSLKLLDGLPKLPCDEFSSEDDTNQSGKCTVS